MMKYSGGITLDNLQTIENEAQAEQQQISDNVVVYKPKPIYEFAKRCFDFIASALMLIILSPFFLVISILVYIGDPGKVFYGHVRIGKMVNHSRCGSLGVCIKIQIK